MTGLPLSEIIHKIRCEGQEALRGALVENGVYGLRDDYKRERDGLKSEQRRQQKPFQNEKKKIDAKNRELNAVRASYQLEGSALEQLILLLGNSTPPDVFEKYRRVQEKFAQYYKDLAAQAVIVRSFNERFAVLKKALDDDESALKKRFKRLTRYYDHQMAYSFRFRITETNVAAAAASWKLPLTYNDRLGSWTIGGGVGRTNEREGDRNAKLAVGLENLDDLDCDDAAPDKRGIRTISYPIRGSIGLAEVLGQYFAVINRVRYKKSDDNGDDDQEKKIKVFAKGGESYTDTIIFTTTINGSVNPSVSISPTSRELFSGSLNFGASRKDYHSVIVGLSAVEDDNSADKITRVLLIQQDDAGLLADQVK